MPLRRIAAFAALALALAGPVFAPAGPAAADPSVDELDRQLAAAAQQLEVLIEEYHLLREDLRVTVAQTAVLTGQVVHMERRSAELSDRVAEAATTAYKASNMGGLSLLLAAADQPGLIRRLDALDVISRQQQDEIAALEAVRDQYVAARRTIEALAGQQRTQEVEVAARKVTVEKEIERLRALRLRVYGPGERGARTTALRDRSVPTPPAGTAGTVIRYAIGQLGKAYRFGADGPDAYDCSGLVVAAYRKAGIDLPHSSRAQYDRSTKITLSELRAGDLVFYYGDIHHVAIYVGAEKIIHAPGYGEPVRVDPVGLAPIHGYGRHP